MMERGICRLPVVPLRAKASHQSELVTQLLFGEDYEVLSQAKAGAWLKVRCRHDSYEAWLSSDQHLAISEEFFQEIERTEYKVSTQLWSKAMINKQPIRLPQGSILPISPGMLFAESSQLSFAEESKPLGEKRDAEFLQHKAAEWLNSPYLWGGRSPAGVDCSGFVQVLFRLASVSLPRDAYQQAEVGAKVPLSKAQPGDLAFFVEKEKITHVGMLYGEGKIIHASGRVRIDTLSKEGIHRSETQTLSHQFSHCRRVL